MRPGFRFRKIKPELLGEEPSDWRAYIPVYAPLVRDLGEVCSLGDRYILSIGAHATHGTLLMDRIAPDPLTIERSVSCCTLLTYALDSPVIPQHSATAPYEARGVKGFDRTFRHTPVRSVERYFSALAEAAEASLIFLEKPRTLSVQRTLMRDYPPRGSWTFYPWPPTDAIWRALHAYALGVAAVAANARVLNFWRAVEAVTTRATRLSLYMSLPKVRTAPVWAEAFGVEQKTVNVARDLKTTAMRQYRVLQTARGSKRAALDFLYWEGRGKAAHADRRSLEYDSGSLVAAQLEDATLLRFFARVAIERAWAAG